MSVSLSSHFGRLSVFCMIFHVLCFRADLNASTTSPSEELLEWSGDEEKSLWSALADDVSLQIGVGEEVFIGAEIMPSDAALLPTSVQERPSLAHLALLARVERPEIFEGGIYGKRGSATVWVATPETVADFDRLWWIMVKVLSEKYGCFIVQHKTFSPSKVKVTCRDRRTVVFQRARGSEMVLFTGRQFDAQGAELVVQRRRIVARLP
jgi:hypothetical protein